MKKAIYLGLLSLIYTSVVSPMELPAPVIPAPHEALGTAITRTLTGSISNDVVVPLPTQAIVSYDYWEEKSPSAHYNNKKTYVCGFPECAKLFATTVRLKEHLFGHLGLKPYHCPAKDFSSSYKCNTFAHIAKAHQGEGLEVLEVIDAQTLQRITPYIPQLPYKCAHADCQFSFTSEMAVNQHMRSTHKESPQLGPKKTIEKKRNNYG